MKKISRIVVVILCFSVLLGCMPCALATQEEKVKPFYINIYSAQEEKYIGEFLIKDEILYVEGNTLKRMHKDIAFASVPEDVRGELCIKRGENIVTYFLGEVLDMYEKVYLPFEKTVLALDLWLQMPVEGTMVVKEPPQLQELFDTLNRIVKESEYDMPYWWGFEEANKDLASATRADGFLGLKLGYLVGSEQRDQYQTACANILVPQIQGELDKLALTTETVQLFKSMYGTVHTFEELLERSDVSIYPDSLKLDLLDLEAFFKTEEMLNVFAYTCCIQKVQNGLDNGLSYVMKTQKPCDKYVVDGATLAIGMLTDELNFFEAAATKILMNGASWAMDTASGKLLPVKAFSDLANIILNEAIGHKKVVDGVIMAHRYLSVQDMCVHAYEELLNRYHAGISYATYTGHESQQIETLIDVVRVYMKAGVLAWLAKANDDVSREAAQAQVEAMNADLAVLDTFSMDEIRYTDSYRSVTQAIIACAATELEDFDVYELPKEPVAEDSTVENTDAEELTNITVEITWNCDYNGQYRFVDTWVYGMADSGAWVERAESEGEYYAADLHVASQEIYDDRTKLTFYDVSGEYRVEIGNFDDWMIQNWSIHDYDLRIVVMVPGQENIVITDDVEKYLMAGMDGYWYYSFGVVDGKITSLV